MPHLAGVNKVTIGVAMTDSTLLTELLVPSAQRLSSATALTFGAENLSYEQLLNCVTSFASGLMHLGLTRGDRVAIYLDKRFETVIASFGVTAAGCVFVPVNPLLKSDQVAYILRDCQVRVLVTSPERFAMLQDVLGHCPDVCHVVVTDGDSTHSTTKANWSQMTWRDLLQSPARAGHRLIDADMAAILYTSGSTGHPKGVVLSHRNMVAGAKSVASYLENTSQDTLLAALPLSFDAGFSQLTTAFLTGARVVLLNYLMPRDVLKAMVSEKVTGLTAVPPLFIQLAQLEWPPEVIDSLRYFANTGGHMPRETLSVLRQKWPKSAPFLMYGLTEAFRSTYLDPQEIDRRPDSIGKAIPNAEILVLRDDDSPCDADEPGELVHRGPLVSLGYWNDATKTAERFKRLPRGLPSQLEGLQLPEYAVYSGDTVRKDSEGFLYFIGRRDEMIKTSGYRVSPLEVEEVLYATQLVGECVAFGVSHSVLGDAIQVIANYSMLARTRGKFYMENELRGELTALCKAHMPVYMVPAGFELLDGPLPRNPNGKIDRKLLSARWLERHANGANSG